VSARATPRSDRNRAVRATRALVLALLAVLVSWSSQPAQAQTQRVLRIALTQEPGTLDPVVGSLAVESDLDQFLFSGLTRYDEHGNQIPDLAERVPTRANGGISADGRSITYHLVHNARWHDGVPVTSADVAFTFDALRNPKNNVTITEPYAEIARVETPDAYTVRIIMTRPWAPAIDGFSDRNGGAIVPAHLLKTLPDLNHADFNAAPVGSGPYRFVAWHRGSTIELEADPNYFRGAPKIGRIVINFLTNDNTMMVALRTHEIDLADRLNISTYTNLGSVPGLLPAINTQSFWEHLNFNTARAPLDDWRVRLALCYGFDVHAIFAKVYHGLGALGPTDQNPLTPWNDKTLGYYPFDPAHASRILADAGWQPAADGIRIKDGRRLSITLSFPAGNTTRDQTGVLLQQYWQRIGVETIVKTYPAATFFAPAESGGPLYGGKTDVALFAWVNAVPDPSNINVDAADRIPPHGGNVAFYASAEVTRLEYAAASTTVFAQRKALYDKIQAIELRDVPFYVLRWAEITDMRAADLDGVRPAIINSTFWNIADWRFR
jgi:peptide/nickel transport system substrate-binding protein